MFKLTVHLKHEMIGIWQTFQRNFELNVFQLTAPDLHYVFMYIEVFSLILDQFQTDISVFVTQRFASTTFYTFGWVR